MQWTDRVRQVKIILVAVAVLIAMVSLFVSHILVSALSKEEHQRMEIWVQALHAMNNADENTDLSLAFSVIQGNNSIPVIVLDSNRQVMDYRNVMIDADNYQDSLSFVQREGLRMEKSGQFIKMFLGNPLHPSKFPLHDVNYQTQLFLLYQLP